MKTSDIIMNVGIAALFVGAFAQYKIFAAVSSKYRGDTIFIPLLGMNGVDAPRNWGIIFYISASVFVMTAVLIFFKVVRRKR